MRFHLLLVFLLLIPVHSVVIINSQDWRDAYLGLLYGTLKGDNSYYLINLGETDILFKTLPRDENLLIFESTSQPVIKNLESFARNYGFKSVKSIYYANTFDLQEILYNDIKDSVEGFVVVPGKFAEFAIISVPLAIKNRYWVIFYDKDYEKIVFRTLSSASEKPAIFLDLLRYQPWDRVKNPSEEICCDLVEVNKEIVKRLWKETGGWIVIAPPDYLEQGSLIEEKPILLISVSPEEAVKFLKELNVSLVEVIGAENVNYGARIREISNRTIGVVAKIGRTFTGSKELRGKFYTLPVKRTPTKIHKLDLIHVYADKDKVVLVFKNSGNVEEEFVIRGIRLIQDSENQAFAFDSGTHYIDPGEIASIPVNVTLGNIKPKMAEVLVNYGPRMKLKVLNYSTSTIYFSVEPADLIEVEAPAFEKIFYDDSTSTLWVKLKLEKSSGIYARAEIEGINVFNRSIVLGTKCIPLKRGSNYLPIPIYMSREDLQNQTFKLRIYYGISKDRLTGLISKEVKGSIVVERRSKLYLLKVPAALLLIALLLYAVYRYMFAKKKKRKYYRVRKRK